MDNMTAKMSCFVRAYHHLRTGPHVFDDVFAGRMLGEDYDRIEESLRRGIDFFLPGFSGSEEDGLRLIVERQLAPSVLGRSAFCEAKLQNEIRLGCRQYLIFAAGYDTYGERCSSPDISVFEFDLPEMMKDKADRMRAAGIESGSVLISCDLTGPDLGEAFLAGGFDPKKKSFVSMLGLTYFFEKQEFSDLIAHTSRLIPCGSAICFDYQTKEDSKVTKTNCMLAAGAGENMKSDYSSDELQLLLQDHGFLIYEHLDAEEMTDQYFKEYNSKNPDHPMYAPEGVAYVLAVKRR